MRWGSNYQSAIDSSTDSAGHPAQYRYTVAWACDILYAGRDAMEVVNGAETLRWSHEVSDAAAAAAAI